MSKLLTLKEWLTPQETADHLSTVFSEPVSVADVYRFALAGHLRLSVNFATSHRARIGRRRLIEDAGFKVMAALVAGTDDDDAPSVKIAITSAAYPAFERWVSASEERATLLDAETPRHKFVMLNGTEVSATECITFENQLESIGGVWDLTMFGAERAEVESLLYSETFGAPVDGVSLNAVMLWRPDGRYAELRESLDRESGKKYAWLDPEGTCPAAALPEGAPIVITPAAISDFIERVGGQNSGKKDLDTRQRTSLLRVVRALEKLARLSERQATSDIVRQLEQLGFTSPGEATVRAVLNEARSQRPE